MRKNWHKGRDRNHMAGTCWGREAGEERKDGDGETSCLVVLGRLHLG